MGEQSRSEPASSGASSDPRWASVTLFLVENDFSANSRKVYQRELRRFLDWTELAWSQLTPQHCSLYRDYLTQEVETAAGKPLSQSSVNSAIAALRSFFNWLIRCGDLATNPAEAVKFEKIPPPKTVTLTPEQMQQVWQALDFLEDTYERDLVLIHLLLHGLRAGEIVALNVGAVGPVGNPGTADSALRPETPDGLSPAGVVLAIADSRLGQPRCVPLLPTSGQIVQQYLQARQAAGEALTPASPLLISHHPGHRGDRLSYHGIYFAIEKIGEYAGLPHLHPYQFRHTYATQLLIQGMPPRHARRLTGHQSEQGFRRYHSAQRQVEAQRRQAEQIRAEQDAAIATFYQTADQTAAATPVIGLEHWP